MGLIGGPRGYGFARLTEDAVRVIDAVGVTNPVVIGHPFAGEEMHVLGARHSPKISGLVYVDAAFDRGDSADSEAFNRWRERSPQLPGQEPPDVLRLFASIWKIGGPDPRRVANSSTNPDESVGGRWARVVELSGTHNLIVSNPRDVLEQIEAFMSSLPERR